MLRKSPGIVLKRSKYGDSGLILKIYTEDLGLQSFIVQGVRRKGGKMKANLFEPLTLLELVFYHKEKNTLFRIKEARQSPPLQSIPFDLVKSSLALFLAELLYKTINDGEPDPQLFQFVQQWIKLLDLAEHADPHFHLVFLVKLAKVLGFCPDRPPTQKGQVFDLNEGLFQDSVPEHNYFLSVELTEYFKNLLGTNFDDLTGLNIPKNWRKLLLEKLLVFYQIHTDNLREVHSHKVLEDIFN